MQKRCMIRKNLKDALREVLEEYFGKPKSFADLDSPYDFMKDSLGYVKIDNLRWQLGMSLEQFIARFKDYILQHYELIPGGEEGFIKGGVMYEIIRRKRYMCEFQEYTVSRHGEKSKVEGELWRNTLRELEDSILRRNSLHFLLSINEKISNL